MPSPRSPRVRKGALVSLDDRGALDRIIAFQYNPETLLRRIDRRGGRPYERITCSLMFDAMDAVERPAENPEVVESGIDPTLAALESLMHPSGWEARGWWPLRLFFSRRRPVPIALLVWGERVVPVRLARLEIAELQHDPALRPIRAKVRARLRVVTDEDLPAGHPARRFCREHVERMRRLAERAHAPAVPVLGVDDEANEH